MFLGSGALFYLLQMSSLLQGMLSDERKTGLWGKYLVTFGDKIAKGEIHDNTITTSFGFAYTLQDLM